MKIRLTFSVELDPTPVGRMASEVEQEFTEAVIATMRALNFQRSIESWSVKSEAVLPK